MRTVKVAALLAAAVLVAFLGLGAAGAAPTPAALWNGVVGAPAPRAGAPVPAAAPAVVPPPVAAGVAAPTTTPPPARPPSTPAPPATAGPTPAAPTSAAPAPAAPAPAAARTTVAEPPPPRTAPGTPCLSTAAACIDLSANQAWLLDDDGDVALGPVPVTHGRKGFRTPPGTFRVSFKNIDHVSSIYDAPMPYSVFFNGGIAFHQGSLRQLSHGCIHLSRDAAKAFYGGLSRGDVVQVVR